MDIKVNDKSVLIFDLDDTLYNEIDYLKSAYKSIASDLEPNSWRLLYSKMFSLYRNKENVFSFLSGNYNISLDDLVKTYRLHEPAIVPFDGVIPLLKSVQQKGAMMGIITDGRSVTQRNKIKSLRINDYFQKIVVSEELGTEKPHPNNFKVMEDHFGPKHYHYIADNFKKDFITPNKMGWTTVGLLDNGLNIHSNSYRYTKKENTPDILIESFKEIVLKN